MNRKLKHTVYYKAYKLLKSLAGNRAEQLKPGTYPSAVLKKVQLSLKDCYGNKSRDIAFHVMDWPSDAAFLIALLMFPEKFSKKEIEKGIIALLVHVPDHLAAAAHLFGEPVTDVWELGLFDRSSNKKNRIKRSGGRALRACR